MWPAVCVHLVGCAWLVQAGPPNLRCCVNAGALPRPWADGVRATATKLVLVAYFMLGTVVMECYAGGWGAPGWAGGQVGKRSTAPLLSASPLWHPHCAANLSAFLTVTQLQASAASLSELQGRAVGSAQVYASRLARHGILPVLFDPEDVQVGRRRALDRCARCRSLPAPAAPPRLSPLARRPQAAFESGAQTDWLAALESGALAAFIYDEPLMTRIDRLTDCSIMCAHPCLRAACCWSCRAMPALLCGLLLWARAQAGPG